MGVFLFVNVNPFRIEQTKWKEVYEEAMLLSHKAGLGYIKYKMCNQVMVPCLAHSQPVKVEETKYVVLNRYLEENPKTELKCWNCCGDVFTGSNMESFDLYDNIEFYRYKCQNSYYGKCNIDMEKAMSQEILFDQDFFDEYEEKYNIYDEAIASVMGGKTQGEYGHMGLLQIGCLLADRFPEAISIKGDITYAQCLKAVCQANEILERPIKMPRQYDYITVFDRLSIVVEDNKDLLKLLQDIYDGPKEKAYYDFVNTKFTEEEICDYYLKQYGDKDKKAFIKEWFKQDLTLEALCKMIAEGYGEQENYTEIISGFIESFIQCKVHKNSKELRDPTELNAVHKSKPDTVGEQFSKIFGMMIGLGNCYVDKYIPLEQLIEVCTEFWGEQNDVKDMFECAVDEFEQDKNVENKDKIYEGIGMLCEQSTEQSTVHSNKEKYDHISWHSLCCWEEGDTVDPEQEENILWVLDKLREFGEARKKDYVQVRKYEESRGELTQLNNFTNLISDNATHVRLFNEDVLGSILSEEFPRQGTIGSVIIGLYSMQCNHASEVVMKALFMNYTLLEFYVDKLEKNDSTM